MIKRLNQQAEISHRSAPSFQLDPKEIVATITAPQRKILEELCQAPNHLLLDANVCEDLAEFGDKLGLESSKTKDGEIVFLETQKSADDKFTHYLRNTSEEDLLHGDRFLKELLQADITELEPKQRLLSSLMVKKENVLPLLVLSKKDSKGQLTNEDELKYKSLLSKLYKVEIDNYLTKASQGRDTDNYVERIRRILRTNARLIDEDSLPRNLSGAWQSEANGRSRSTRIQLLSTTGFGVAALGVAFLTALYNDSSGKVDILTQEVFERQDELKARRNLSILKGDTVPTSTQEQLKEMLNLTEREFFIDLSNALINEASKKFPTQSESKVSFLIGNLNQNKIKIKTDDNNDRINIVIPVSIFQKLYKDVTTSNDTSKKEVLLSLLPQYL